MPPVRLALLLVIASLSASGQNTKLGAGIKIGHGLTVAQGSATPIATVLFTATLSSNANSSQGTAPTRKQLGNAGTGCSGGVIQPTGVPIGQLYATSAIATAAIAAGCTNQGSVSSTVSGTGTTAFNNGFNAGGTDSPVTVTNTDGGGTNDPFCTADAYSTPTVINGLTTPGCTINSGGTFAESTAIGHGNSDVLFPTGWNSSAGVDAADHWFRQIYFRINNLANLWNWEVDTNYTASDGSYFGWGKHWNRSIAAFQYCPQNCTGWVTERWTNVATGAVVTSYPFVVSHIYGLQMFYSRDAGCTYSSLSKCYWYDFVRIWDVTAGTAPVLYSVLDNATGTRAGGIPINHTTWTKPFPHTQVQIDMTAANASTSVDVDSDIVMAYHF